MVDAKEQTKRELRKLSIGASDSPKILLGEAFGVWAEKTGLAKPPDLDAVEEVFWGNRLEQTICDVYRERSGRAVRYNEQQETSVHQDFPWMTATLDADQTDTDDGPFADFGALEIKTTGYWPGKAWDAGPPLKVQIQLQHQLAVRDMKWGSMAVLIAGQKLRWFDMQRNDRFIEKMIAKLAFFWTQVIEKVPPNPDGSIATTDTLKRMFPEDSGKTIALPGEASEWDECLVATKAEIKTLENEKRLLENRIKAELGDAATGVLPGGDRYTFKSQTSHYEAKEAYENTFRVLRRLK